VLLKATALIALDDLLEATSSADDDNSSGGGCSETEQGRSSMIKQGRPGIQEGKSWDWIFGKFPSRTPAAVRMRWTMV
jgi:hypothetical protein